MVIALFPLASTQNFPGEHQKYFVTQSSLIPLFPSITLDACKHIEPLDARKSNINILNVVPAKLSPLNFAAELACGVHFRIRITYHSGQTAGTSCAVRK
ncbi:MULTISPECIES: hypothetical protein [Burkholderia]|jgi:hypothetical protein|uniref:hypothetical protein n=1 Tax=Burkholderia TaxID=32008 RepID=UPI001416F673|nr:MULTISPECIES: hypothetical protein [Burkholderia]MDP9550038.1 hypothetical protein [Burkholderia cepacia]MBR8394832.1 hypothetical protein [Burkholderia cenocepacia]MBR8473629.1 hypothetical protein [Burkholderia cenocepacia]MBR8493611.1 hypothetical protein [Burkholderia cenocepacia]MDO5923824.1 hypothetical protein [Burkholderia cenocepacia]